MATVYEVAHLIVREGRPHAGATRHKTRTAAETEVQTLSRVYAEDPNVTVWAVEANRVVTKVTPVAQAGTHGLDDLDREVFGQ